MNFRLLNIAFFENRHHPSISLELELYAVSVYSRRAACMYEKGRETLITGPHVMFLVHSGTYQYVLDKNSCTCMYRYVVRTGTYQYIPVHTILPDPVQVYRIPDVVDSEGAGEAPSRRSAGATGTGKVAHSLASSSSPARAFKFGSCQLQILSVTWQDRIPYKN
jgi:hypothetical protein